MIIYKTTNTVNGKIYVGQSIYDDPDYLGSGKVIMYAIAKYGRENFTKEILEELELEEPPRKNLDTRETHWIAKLDACNPEIGYNISHGGVGGYNEHAVIANRKKRGKTWEEIYSPDGLEVMRSRDYSDNWKNFKIAENGAWNKGMKNEYTMPKRSEESKQRSSIAMKNSQKHKAAMADPKVRAKISKSVSKANKILWQNSEYRTKVLEGRRLARLNNPTIKKEELERLLNSGKSVTEMIYELGVSIPTYYKYKKRYGM